jgi:hypothetical protein
VIRTLVTPINGTVQRLDLGDPGFPCISGQVVSDGTSLINSRLLLASTDSPNYGDPMCFAQTDEWGSFVFRGISPGDYTLYYKHPNQFREFTEIASVEVESQDLDVGVIYYDCETNN